MVTEVEPFDGDEHLAERETAFVLDLGLLRRARDHGVHEHAIFTVVDEDEDAAQDPDLRRREADAVRLVHESGHPLDEPPEVGIEALDLACLHSQRGVAVLADPREREQTPRFAFELGLLVALLVLVLVVVVLVIVVVLGHWRGESSPPRAGGIAQRR